MAPGEVRILVIDDEPPLLRMMTLYLERQGYSVTVAPTAAKARVALAEGGFAVVVLDASLPGTTLAEMGGEILCGDPAVHLLAASGYPADTSALETLAPGRVAFLLKPFSPDMLAACVRRLLGVEEEGV